MTHFTEGLGKALLLGKSIYITVPPGRGTVTGIQRECMKEGIMLQEHEHRIYLDDDIKQAVLVDEFQSLPTRTAIESIQGMLNSKHPYIFVSIKMYDFGLANLRQTIPDAIRNKMVVIDIE